MTDPTALPNFSPSTPTQTQPETPAAPEGTPLRDRVVGSLSGAGLQPSIDPDGDVAFSVEDTQLFVRVVEGAPGMVRIFGQWQITDEVPNDLQKQLLATNDVTLSLNIIKAGIANGTLVVTGEHLIFGNEDLNMLLQSTTQMVMQAVPLWHQSVLGDGPHAATAAEQMAPAAEQTAAEQTAPDGTAGPQA